MATRTKVVDEETSAPAKAPRRRAPKAGSGRDQRVEKYLVDKGVQWEFVENVSPGSFDLNKSMRNQARLNKLITTQVETYVDAMRRGDRFPAIIAHREEDSGKLVTVDGNHRLEASRQLDRPMDVYVVSGDPKIITLMTFEANTRHGMPTSPQERVIHALWLIDTGASLGDAAALVGARLNEVKKEYTRRQAERRADEIGIPRNQWEAIHPSARQRLLNLKVDEVFKAGAELAYKGNLGVQEVFDLVTKLNETTSMTRQMAIIEHLTTNEYQERIASGAAIFGSKQGRAKQTPKTRANMVLGQLLTLPDNVASLVTYYSPQERENTAQKARDGAKRLSELADALEEANSQA